MFELLEQYQAYLINQRGVSKNTCDAYVRDVSVFLNYVDISVSHRLEDVRPEDLKSFCSALKKQGKSVSTINRCTASVHSFYRFLRLSGQALEDPTEQISRIHEKRKLPSVLSDKEIGRLLKAPDNKLPKGCRDKAMFELLYATGMRVSELIELNLEDVQLKAGCVCCHSGNLIRTIPIYAEAKRALQDYLLRVYPYYAKSEGDALFVNMNGTRLTRQGFWKILKQYVDELGLPGDITPLTLRHSFAAHLLENGAQLEDVREMLGHADISSTQIYAQIVNNKFKDVYNRCHPRAKSV